MKTDSIEYRDGEVTLRGFVAFDDRKSDKRPGVLLMPEAFGLGAQVKRRAERLAELGYVALAGDPYGDGQDEEDQTTGGERAQEFHGDPFSSSSPLVVPANSERSLRAGSSIVKRAPAA